MANFFSNQNGNMNQGLSERQILANKYNRSRSNLLLVAIFTAINILMLTLNSGSYFLFSATIPYFLISISMEYCGMFPAEWYEQVYENGVPYEFVDNSLFIGAVVVSVIIAVFFLLCYIFSKNLKRGWLISALVLYVIDTAFIFRFFNLSAMILDIVFHIWVLVGLVMGISAYNKLKALPADEPSYYTDANVVSDDNNNNSTYLNGEQQ